MIKSFIELLGRLGEWIKPSVLKTEAPNGAVGSNPTPSSRLLKVKVVPLSTKMRSKVKEYGDIWTIEEDDSGSDPIYIRTTKMVHCKGTQPYGCWVLQGDECVLEFIDLPYDNE